MKLLIQIFIQTSDSNNGDVMCLWLCVSAILGNSCHRVYIYVCILVTLNQLAACVAIEIEAMWATHYEPFVETKGTESQVPIKYPTTETVEIKWWTALTGKQSKRLQGANKRRCCNRENRVKQTNGLELKNNMDKGSWVPFFGYTLTATLLYL